MSRIHKTALVDAKAELDASVEVGPYSIVGPGVKIGRGSKLHSHVVIQGRTSIGEGNTFFPFASVGSIPQDLKYKGEPSELIMGDHNLLMMYCHIAHDCLLGNWNIIANGATLGGHVVIENYVIVGGLAGIHQFVKIGTGAILGA